MGRGFFSGLVWGLVFLGLGAAVLSLLAPMPQSPDAVVQSPAVGDSGAASQEAGLDGSDGDSDVVELAPTAPEGSTAQPGDLTAMEGSDTKPAALPQVGAATGELDDPASQETDVVVSSESAAPELPAVQTEVPTSPGGETELSISTEPAQPTVPVTTEVGSGFGTSDGSTEDGPEITTSQSDPVTVAPTEPSTQSPEEPEPVGKAPEAVTTAPRIAALPQAGGEEESPRTTLGTPAKPLIPLEEPEAETEEPIVLDTDVVAIETYGVAFDNAEGKPLMSILLIDDDLSVGIEALADFPYPLSFALNPLAPGAAERMAAHRAAGFEVVAMLDLPEGSTAQDAEVLVAAALSELPETVAILEGIGTGIQRDRAAADQVAAITRDTGRGLITQDRGLNTVQKLAQRDGIPSAIVFRDFDGAGQRPAVIRRFLDQAAFRAGQLGAVVMLGRVRPDTVSALLIWGLQDRAGRVALAPVSASLKALVAD